MSTPFLVKDINPSNLTVVGNTLYFSAADGVNGTELWKSDGTALGTVLVKDIRPGSSSSSPGSLTVVGNTLYFTSDDGVNGKELWKSDGTAAGTVLVKDIRPGSSSSGGVITGGLSSNPRNLTAVGNTLYFNAFDDVNGEELWKSDGTAAGTVLVADIGPGSNGSGPRNLTAVGNTLYFTAFDDVNGEELWKSDGTAAGTVRVKDIRPGSNGSNIRFPTAVGNTLFFTADNGVNGRELWKSDGTAAGTVLVKDIAPGSSNPSYLTAVGNTVFFSANDGGGYGGVNGRELWKSDGTAAGTVLVKDIGVSHPYIPGTYPNNLTAVGNTLFFTPIDSVNGRELWKSDGTAAGTVLVKDIRPGYSSSLPRYLTAVGNTLYFTAFDDVNGEELWKSDGTAAGTVLVADIRPGSNGSNPRNLRVVGSTLYFSANDGVNGYDLWALNVGTPAVPTLAIAATSANQTEGNSGSKAFTFTVTRAVNTTGSNNVNWAVTGSGSNPANATDFVGGVLPSGVVSFTTGEISKVITVDVQGDTTVEPNENFTVTLSNATNGATITTATATGAIQNDDTSVTLAVSPASVTEDGTSNLVYTFTRSGVTTSALTVNYGIGGTATLNTDYTRSGTNNTVTFAANATTATVIVDPTADTTVENNETVALTLTSGTGYTIGTPTAVTGTINNDDTNVTLAVSPGSVTEDGTNNLVYTFTRSGVTSNALTVNYTLGGTATLNTDYTRTGTTNTVTFVAGSSTATVTVDPTADTIVESNETVILTLAAGTGYTIGTPTAVTGTITNDDFSQLSINDIITVVEGKNSNAVLTVTVNNPNPQQISVNYATAPIDANANVDYTSQTGTLIIPANASTATITIPILNDDLNEPDEVFAVTLSNATNAIINPDEETAGVIITDTWQSILTRTLPNGVENLKLIGTNNINGTGNAGNNNITGNSGNNQINGGAGIDILTGGPGADTFIFQFGQSTISTSDRITDFAINTDKIDLLTQGGLATNAPISFSRAANSTVTTLQNLINQVFTDANGAITGNQGLGVNSAALVQVTTGAIAGTYLVINDSAAGFQSSNDLLINITGFTGALPALGNIPVGNFFV